jgi:diguanylate cyclase (GGDEF)-like protein
MPSNHSDKSLTTRNTLAAIRDLDLAIAHHIDWLRNIHATLITHRPADANDLRVDAHHLCDFGKWFYGAGMANHQLDAGYAEIDKTHHAMHDAARKLLDHSAAGAPIDLSDYENFMDLAIAFKQEVRTFQYALINQVCTVDHLTGAWNRHALAMKLLEESERTQRSGQCCALCMMDIDYFKRVNDRFGHKVGDEVLQAFTSIVSTELRKYDSLFRYGGEEFLMLLPNTTLENAALLLNRIRETLSETDIPVGNGATIRLTASFGVAQLACQETVEDALEHADHALLAAKAGGRNKVCVWDISQKL